MSWIARQCCNLETQTCNSLLTANVVEHTVRIRNMCVCSLAHSRHEMAWEYITSWFTREVCQWLREKRRENPRIYQLKALNELPFLKPNPRDMRWDAETGQKLRQHNSADEFYDSIGSCMLQLQQREETLASLDTYIMRQQHWQVRQGSAGGAAGKAEKNVQQDQKDMYSNERSRKTEKTGKKWDVKQTMKSTWSDSPADSQRTPKRNWAKKEQNQDHDHQEHLNLLACLICWKIRVSTYFCPNLHRLPFARAASLHFRVLHFHFNVTTHVFVVKAYGQKPREGVWRSRKWREKPKSGRTKISLEFIKRSALWSVFNYSA